MAKLSEPYSWKIISNPRGRHNAGMLSRIPPSTKNFGNDIAATELAIDGQIEERQISYLTLDL